jgi:capsid protein
LSAESYFGYGSGIGGGGGGFMSNGYQGADFSRLRGMVYFPELDTRFDVTSYTRTEILRKVRFLYANHGLPKRIVNGCSRMVVGTGLTVHASTTDTAWNELAESYFYSRANSPVSWDVGGRYTFDKGQLANTRWRFRDGDAGNALTTSPTGQAMQAYYEGHQIGNGTLAGTDNTDWRDGVLPDRHNRAIAYRILGFDGEPVDIPASAFILNCDYDRGGAVRGLSMLHHAIPHLLDGTEILGFIKAGVKLANQFGYVIEDEPLPGGGSPTGAGRAGGQTRQVDVGGGKKITLEQVHGGGVIPELGPGKRIKFLSDSRPHPNNIQLLDYMIRDIAWGCDLAPDILWNIAALGGANTRFVLADAQGWIEAQQQELVNTYCGRSYIHAIACGLATKRLRPCKDPQWWKHVWIPPPRLTVDFGRDGKMHLEQLKAGALTYKRLYGWQGLDWKPEVTQDLDESAFILKGLKDREVSLADYLALKTRNNAPQNPEEKGQGSDSENTGDDGLPTNPDEASAFLGRLAKNPEAAAAFMRRMSANAG